MSSGRRNSIVRLWQRIKSLTARKHDDESTSDNVESPLKNDSTENEGEMNSATKTNGNEMDGATEGGSLQTASDTNQSSSHGKIL